MTRTGIQNSQGVKGTRKAELGPALSPFLCPPKMVGAGRRYPSSAGTPKLEHGDLKGQRTSSVDSGVGEPLLYI